MCLHKVKKCAEKYGEFYIASPETAEQILERIGFGKQECEETKEKDGRYGYWSDAIYYGFAKSICGKIKYGMYVIFDYPYDSFGYVVVSPDDFKRSFIEFE